jgi:hypothetical protein
MDTTTQAEPESLAALHEQDARALRLLLLEMAQWGSVMAGLYAKQAQDQAESGEPGAGPSPACAAAYSSVTRSVRRTVLLIQKLTAPAPAAKAADPEPDKVSVRKQIIRQVEDAIHRNAPEGEEPALYAEFLERLEGAEFDDQIPQRPTLDIVNEICADLGVHGPDSLDQWMRRTPADIAALYALAAAPCGAARAGAGLDSPIRADADSPGLPSGTGVAVRDG